DVFSERGSGVRVGAGIAASPVLRKVTRRSNIITMTQVAERTAKKSHHKPLILPACIPAGFNDDWLPLHPTMSPKPITPGIQVHFEPGEFIGASPPNEEWLHYGAFPVQPSFPASCHLNDRFSLGPPLSKPDHSCCARKR